MMILALAGIVPVLVVAGLALRQSIPLTEDVTPSRSASSRGESFETLGEQAVGQALPIRVSWMRATRPPARYAVAIAVEAPLERPDLLVYWDEDPVDGDSPSEDARLLGRVGGRREAWWEVSEPGRGGRLVFYSTAWNEIAGSISPPEGWTDAP
jgi:hypothetical protein